VSDTPPVFERGWPHIERSPQRELEAGIPTAHIRYKAHTRFVHGVP
jgi:hypothetical protein